MRDGQPRGGILVGDDAAVVDTGLTCHCVGFNGQDVAFCPAQCVSAVGGNGSGAASHIPLD